MTELANFFVEPLSYPFMQRAMMVAICVGAVCAVLSCFLVLQGWSLMGDAISHAVLPGIVLAFVAGLPLAVGAFAAGLTAAVATGFIKETSRIKEDTVMGIVFSGMFALGLVLFVKIDTDQHLNHILFGNMLGVTAWDVAETAAVCGVVLVAVLLRRRDLALLCFDRAHARAIGLDVGLLHYGLLVALALAIVASLKAVGVILVVAMLIGPGATALLVARDFATMIRIALGVALASTVIGTLVSYHVDGATGPVIVLVQSSLFVLAFLRTVLHSRLRRQTGSVSAQ